MSNVLVSDEGFDGVVIKTDRLCDLKCCDDIIVAECGVSLPALACFSAKRGLSGIEALSGIPGSLGAGVMINAGAFGREIGEVVESVLVYSVAEGDIIRLGAEEIKFNYRSTSLTNSVVFLSATIKLSYSSSLEVFSEMNRIREVRRSAQPSLPSLGSVFKRPNAHLSAGKLVDLCGLKGYKCGGAQISEKHAGFIVNQGNATAKDYLFLMEYTRECVFSRFGIKLENEVEIMEY
jgi:UDP-N-acetylmuramate dehydrogenase